MAVLFHFNSKIWVLFGVFFFFTSTTTFSKEKKNKPLCAHLDVLYLVGKCDKVPRRQQSMIPTVSCYHH